MSESRLGKRSLQVVLLVSLYLLTSLYHDGLYQGIKLAPVSLLGWVLPSQWLQSPLLLILSGLIFVVAAVFWFLDLAVPWSSWCATLSFTLAMSLYVENVPFWDHQMNLANQLMWIFCAWYHFYPEPERSLPSWVPRLCLFAVVCGYTMSGLAKVMNCGFGWGDGLSLQIWILTIGYPQSTVAQLLLEHRELAQSLQTGVLMLELSMPLALVWKPYRRVAGTGLACFHLACLYLFQYLNFAGNLVLVLVFLVIWPAHDFPSSSRIDSVAST